MRKVFTFMFALCITVIANAQFPDSSKWNPGQDISADLSWGDYSGTWSAGGAPDAQGNNQTPNASPYWQGTQPTELSIDATSDPTTNPYPAVAFYQDGAGTFLPDMYQVIPLPAGYYTFSFQATYREGTADDTWASFNAGNPKFNGRGYVNVLAGNSPDAEVISAYECPILTLPYSTIKEKLYINDDTSKSWKSDGMYTWIGEAGADSCSYPCSSDGAATHFLAGNYKHSLKFILLEDGYIRLGIKKVAGISQDWLVWSNMQIWYEGPADEEAQRALADEHFQDAMGELATLQSRIEKEGYIALVSLLEDAMIELEGDYDGGTTEELNEGTQKAVEIRQQYEAAFVSAQSLGDLINMSEDMFVATDFPGKAEFEFAIEAAKEVAFADYVDDVAEYKDAFDGLSTSRAAYLDSQDFDADGNKDFTMLIKNPWFVNAEYTPEYLPVDGNESTKAWQLTEETWADRSALGNPDTYAKIVNGRTDIASNVVLSADVEATNQWFKRVNYDGWSPGLQLYYQSCLVGSSSGWNSINTGSEEICQQLVGLPEGYYSLKALMRGDAGASWTTPDGVSSFHNIYAMNSAEEVVKSDFNATAAEANNNMGNGWYEWNPLAWVEHKTGIIQVPDGKLLIAAQTSNMMNATGFRLYFHGESPEFDKMIQTDIDAVNAKYEALAFAGDKKYVKDLLDQIVLPIGTDAALYEANMALIKEANKYMATVNDYMKNYKAVENFTALQGGYAEGTDQFAIIDVPFQYVLALGEKDTETYVDAQAADKMYTAYAEYMPVYDKALKYKNDEIAKLLADQTAYLKANMADPTLLKEYVAALSIPTNVEMIKQLGGETASEENPLDITSILKNPTFVDTSGWEGTSISQNEYARNNAEIWNQTTFDFYQAIPYMPAGKYKVTAQALYRDGAGSADLAKCYQNWLDAGQDKNEWANHNATLYVKAGGRTGKDYVTSVCDTKNTELSFADYFDFSADGTYTIGGNGKFLFYDELEPGDKAIVDAEGRENYGIVYDPAGAPLGQYPFDGRVDLYDADSTVIGSLFFPESMAGAALRFQKGDYPCEAIVNALEEGTLQVGINKTAGVSGDWVIFTNFKLYYLGEPEDETTPEPNPSANLITDDPSYNFNDAEYVAIPGANQWTPTTHKVANWTMLYNNNSGKGTIDVASPGYNKSAKCMTFANTEVGDYYYSAQVEYALSTPLVKGKSYIAQFYAKADEGTTGEFQFSAEAAWDANVTKYQFFYNTELTPTWKLYSVEFVVPEEAEGVTCEDLTAVKFNFGKLVGKAYVDRVIVCDANAEINPDGNLIVDDESFAFNGGTLGNWTPNQWNNNGGKAKTAAAAPGWNGSNGCISFSNTAAGDQYYSAQTEYNLETPMEMGKKYTVSFYARADEGFEGEFQFSAEAPWEANVNKYQYGQVIPLTTDWALYSYEVLVPEELDGAVCENLTLAKFNFGKFVGTAYVDHIVIVSAIVPEVNPEGNLIADDASYGFEDGTTGKWSGWGGTIENAAPGYESEGCLHLVRESAGNGWDGQCVYWFDSALPTGHYTFECWAKSGKDGSTLGTCYQNEDYSKQGWPSTWNLTTEWQKYTCEFDINDEGIVKFIFNFGASADEFFIDRIVLLGESAVSINDVENVVPQTSVRYNLAGQVVGSDYKGIVIENGKKRLIK